jgi:hypothetical protein
METCLHGVDRLGFCIMITLVSLLCYETDDEYDCSFREEAQNQADIC